MKKKIALVPSAYNPAAMGDVENFIKFYKDDFDVYVITDKETKTGIEEVDGIRYVEEGRRYATYIKTTAEYIIDAGTISSANKVYKDQKRISVWHGIPYKKMFVDLNQKHAITAIDYCACYDLMISPSKWYTERFLRNSMLYEGEVLETAISRTDSLFIGEEKKKEIRARLGIPDNKRVLLYAPTFREQGVFTIPFNTKKVQQVLGDEWVIVIKAHYLNTIDNTEGIIDATSYHSINNLMAMTDCMITDYSSTLFDYSVLGKPALLYQYDREQYESERSFMFSMEDYIDSNYILFDEGELLESLKEIDRIGDNLEKIRKKFYPHQQKNSTEQLVKQLNFDKTEREIGEVIFLVNDLNEIGGVHSFVLNLAKEFKKSYGAKIYVFGINEFNPSKDKVYVFDKEDIIDIKLSYENNPGSIRSILSRTDGYVITCQYSAQLKFQKYLKKKKVILMFHGDTEDIVNRNMYTWHLDSLNSGRLRNYSKLAFLTEGNCKVIKGSLNEGLRDKVVSMENGMDFSDAADLYQNGGDFALVTRLDDDKNPMEAVELFSSERLNPSYRLHIYGDGALRDDIEKTIRERRLEERITLHGFVSDKKEIYKGKQGLISVSLTEGLPLTIIEGIKYGIPAYAYDSFTSCEDLVNEKTGKRVETGNLDAFVEALNNPFDMSCFDNREIIEKYSNEKVILKWKRLFDEIDSETKGRTVDAENNSKKDVVKKPVNKNKKKRKKALRRTLKRVIRRSFVFKNNDAYARLSWKLKFFREERKKEHPLVSIVMPFYNNNNTIVSAVDSVANNGYKNYEIVMVNDGSPQNPLEVIPKRIRKKIKYYYKENSGLGETRNYGVERAKGKYLIFLDSDDMLYAGAIGRLVDYAEKHNLEMVTGKTVRIFKETGLESEWYGEIYKKSYINRKEKRFRLFDDTISTGKLYRLSTLKEKDIRFLKGVYEDLRYSNDLYQKIDNIGVINKKILKWMVYGAATSISTNLTLETTLERLKNGDIVFQSQSEFNKIYFARYYIRHQMVASVYEIKNYTDEERRTLFETLKKGLKEREPYIVERLIQVPSKRAMYKAILEDDYDRFLMIAEAYSEQYYDRFDSEQQ